MVIVSFRIGEYKLDNNVRRVCVCVTELVKGIT